MAYPESSIDATISKRMDMSFADQGDEFRAQTNRGRAGDAAVAELVRNGNARAALMIDARAAQVLLTDKLAEDILAQRSARDQPGSTAFALPVVPQPKAPGTV